MPSAWRRRFTKQSLPGWVVVAGLTIYNIGFGAWHILSAWSNVDFLLTKVQVLRDLVLGVSGTVIQTVVAAFSHLNWNLVQAILYLFGIGWILLTSAPGKPAAAEISASATVAAEPKVKRRSPKELKKAALDLLLKALKHGEVLHQSDDWDLAQQWDLRNTRLIRAAWGEAELKRYLDDTGYRTYSAADLIAIRMNKMRDIGRRLEFDDPPIQSDFVPEQCGYEE